MAETEKQFAGEVHDGAFYAEVEKHKAALSPSSGSEVGQDAHFGINEKALLRKLDLKLLPALTLLYLLSFLDRSNGRAFNPGNLCSTAHGILVANARVEGLVVDLHMSRLACRDIIGPVPS